MAQAKNPYIAGNPVGGSAAFVGRDDVLRAVQRVLGDPQHHGIVLYGQRRIGKTSILRHLAAGLPKSGGPRAIYFDLQDKAARPVGAILVDLAGKIAATMDLPDPEPVGDAEAWFRDTWLPPVLGGLPVGESLVVLLDEFDVLADAESQKAASASFFGYLRELLEKVAPRLRLVFVIGRNLEELSYLVGPLFKALPREHVSLLAQQEAAAVARLSEKNGSLAWGGGAVAKVWELTHGHPYLLQHLCWQVWQRAHEGGQAQRAVSAEDVEAAAPGTIDASGNALDWLWGGLPPAAKVVAAALAKAGGGVISEKQLEATLKESGVRVLIRELQDAPALLSKWDIIEPIEGGHRFRVELLRWWIVRNKPLALVQQELDHIEPQAELLYKSGEGFYKSGDVEGAMEQLQKATRINPNHRRANELVAEIHISRSAWSEARQVLEKLAENYPAQARPRLVQVLLAQVGGAKEEGQQLNLYEQALQLDEKNATAIEGRRAIWKSRGDRALDAGSYGEAREAYAAAGLEKLVEEVNLLGRKLRLASVEERVRELETTEQYAEALGEIHLAQTDEQLAGLKDWLPYIVWLKSAQAMAADYRDALRALKEGDREAAISRLARVIGARPKYKDAARLLYETVSHESMDSVKAVVWRVLKTPINRALVILMIASAVTSVTVAGYYLLR